MEVVAEQFSTEFQGFNKGLQDVTGVGPGPLRTQPESRYCFRDSQVGEAAAVQSTTLCA